MTKYNVTINGESGVVDPRLGSWENNILTKLPQQWRITIFMFIKTIPVEKLEINSYVIGEIKISPIEQEFKQSAFEDLRDAYLFLGKCSSTHHIYDTGNTWIVADQRDPKIEDSWLTKEEAEYLAGSLGGIL